jgi:hypothetical protein
LFVRLSFSSTSPFQLVGHSILPLLCFPQFDQAKEDYKRALAIEPQNEKLQHDYAMLSKPL